jgi:hypothetical protein
MIVGGQPSLRLKRGNLIMVVILDLARLGRSQAGRVYSIRI